ncbi:MAG: SipW-dependent-type signal peptide-containing protein [Symbiobacterium sp.]|uniref:SipW-dependent-type signal peptide-containing protein n=1 Tax=Symbiobacterium sp. TaxID=1971213 RepID=UPI003463F5C7
MNKKLLMVLGSTAAVAAVSIGGTLALFSDAKSATGDFAAGTLCITSERNDGDTTPGPMFYITAEQGQTPDGLLGTLPTGVWAPGDSVTRTLNVYNPRSCSTMDAWLTAVSARLTEGIPNQYVQMADELTVVISTPYGEGSNAPTVTVAEAPLRDFLDGPVPIRYPDGSKIKVHLTGTRQMQFNVTFNRDAGNEFQDKTLVVDFIVHAEQMRNNP